jgi:SAM-dependent methyltransferase
MARWSRAAGAGRRTGAGPRPGRGLLSTCVPGVGAAGNVTHVGERAIGAAAAGARTGAAADADLVTEETSRAVDAYGGPFSAAQEREVCERVLGDRRHGLQSLYAGKETTMPDAPQQTPSAAEQWDARYRERERVWSGEPNAVLVREATDLAPGQALDLGCGEGADAVWLARRGWHVTAVDVSRVALRRAAEHAREAGLDGGIDFRWHDLTADFPAGAYDLVTAMFLHSVGAFPREGILRRAVAAVAPGGVLLIAGHAEFPAWHEHPPEVELPSAAETLRALDLPPEGWEVLRAEELPRTVTGPDGRTAELDDAVVKVRRLRA